MCKHWLVLIVISAPGADNIGKRHSARSSEQVLNSKRPANLLNEKIMSWPIALPALALALFVAAAALSTGGCSSDKGGTGQKIVVQGSDTMAQMVRAWSAAFGAAHPGCLVEMQTADTGAGIAQLIDGKINIAAASRDLTETELALAHEKRVHLSRNMVAKDAVAIVVSANNPIIDLTMDELKGIFSGGVNRWSQIKSLPAAGQDKPIVVIGREANSGTGEYLREHVLDNKPFGPHIKVLPSSEAVIAAVEKQKEAIGFVGMSQAEQAGDKVKVVTVRLNDSSPAAEKVTGGATGGVGNDYPLTRPLYLYYDPAQDTNHFGNGAKSFVDFCKSDAGQKIARGIGFMVIR
ncbi:MAG: PstS family phosphate ABC transporter substrate-binding protein [Cyanobacteria bacterium REEB67]|nr:PstS family phosphate ABC transporter substrate-binding protein [Cyanobacteria bacterium REEB67]